MSSEIQVCTFCISALIYDCCRFPYFTKKMEKNHIKFFNIKQLLYKSNTFGGGGGTCVFLLLYCLTVQKVHDLFCRMCFFFRRLQNTCVVCSVTKHLHFLFYIALKKLSWTEICYFLHLYLNSSSSIFTLIYESKRCPVHIYIYALNFFLIKHCLKNYMFTIGNANYPHQSRSPHQS